MKYSGLRLKSAAPAEVARVSSRLFSSAWVRTPSGTKKGSSAAHSKKTTIISMRRVNDWKNKPRIWSWWKKKSLRIQNSRSKSLIGSRAWLPPWEEQHELNEKIQELEKKKQCQRQQIFDLEDEIAQKRDEFDLCLGTFYDPKTDF